MRFSLIDRITELKTGDSIQAIKNLSLAEEYLHDHFPGFPIMPGVLMVEAMVQTSAWLLRATNDFEFSTVVLKEAKAVKFNSFVSPGQTLVLTSSLVKQEGPLWTFKASGSVGETNTVSGRIVLQTSNVIDSEPKNQNADRIQTQAARELFSVLTARLGQS